MSIFKRIFGKKTSDKGQSEQQAVLVYLNGANLPDHIYQEYDLSSIEDKLVDVIERHGLGEFDGNEIGPGETILFMYGPDAERLFAGSTNCSDVKDVAQELMQRKQVESRMRLPGHSTA